MKIGICCYPSYGGSGVVATELGIQLAELGHQVHFIAHNKPFRLSQFHPNVFFHEVEVPNYPVFIHPPYLLAMADTIQQVDEYFGLDLLHAHYAVPHSTAIWMAREMLGRRIPLVTTLHGTDVTILAEEEGLRHVNRFSINRSDAVTAVSDSLKHQAETQIGLEGVRRIYNFIEESRCVRLPNQEIRASLGILPEEAVVVHTSNFRPVKRIADVVGVFARVAQEHPAKLLLIGEGPDLNLAHCQVRRAGLEDRVLFLGNQGEVHPLLSAGDVFLLPSEKESFGLAALEAMASGVPVVASAVGGLPELVENGQTGFTCPLGDVECMARTTLRLLRDPGLREAMGQRAQVRAREVFGARRIVPQYVSLYEELIGRENGV